MKSLSLTTFFFGLCFCLDKNLELNGTSVRGEDVNFVNVLAVNGTKIFGATAYGLYVSTNNGTSWTTQSGGATLNDIFFVGASTATAVGAYGMILRTTIGGEIRTAWTSQLNGSNKSLQSEFLIGANIGMTVSE